MTGRPGRSRQQQCEGCRQLQRAYSGFIGVTSNSGLSSDSPSGAPQARRQQREAQRVRLACIPGRVGGPPIGGGDPRGMQKKAAVFGAFGQGAGHQRRRFIDLSGGGERPCHASSVNTS